MRMKRITLLLASLVLAFGLMTALSQFAFSAQAAAAPDEVKPLQELPPQALEEYGPSDPAYATTAAEVCDASMVGYWRLEESAPNYADSSSNGNSAGGCSGEGCPTRVVGKVGYGQEFNPEEDDWFYIDDDLEDFDFPTNQDFTVEAWLKPEDCSTLDQLGNSRSTVAVGRSSDGEASLSSWWLGCRTGTGEAYFELSSDQGETSPSIGVYGPSIANGFHHVVGVWDASGSGRSGTASIYVDGAFSESQPITFASDFDFSNPLTFGWFQGDIITGTQHFYFPWEGILDEVGIYRKALSLDEVSKHYKGGVGRSYCNTAPALTNPGLQTATENTAIPNLQIAGTDPEGDAVSYTAGNLPLGLAMTTGGLISGTPTSDAAEKSPYTVVITGTDNGAPPAFSTISFTWTVSNVNRKPVVTNPGTQTSAEGSTPALTVQANDPDNTPTNSGLVFTITNLPKGLTYNQDTGQITGSIAYDASKSSPYNVTVTVSDKASPPAASDLVNFTWNVTDVNTGPKLTKPEDKTTPEGASVSVALVAVDEDGDALTFTATNLPPGLSLVPGTNTISGVVSFEADNGHPYDVTVRATDPSGLYDEKHFTWNIGGMNRAPVVTNPGTKTFGVGETVSIQIQASDPDGDAISFSDLDPATLKHTLPSWLTLEASGKITGIVPTGADAMSPFKIVIVASDTNGAASSPAAFDLVVGKPSIYIPLILRNISTGS